MQRVALRSLCKIASIQNGHARHCVKAVALLRVPSYCCSALESLQECRRGMRHDVVNTNTRYRHGSSNTQPQRDEKFYKDTSNNLSTDHDSENVENSGESDANAVGHELETESKESKQVQKLSPFCVFDTTRAKEVSDEELPSARDVSEMIPTMIELQRQLPDANRLEAKYMHGEAMEIPTLKFNVNNAESQKRSDPVSDLLFGTAESELSEGSKVATNQFGEYKSEDVHKPRITKHHVLLAYKALFIGTVYAVLTFIVVVGASMYLCGYYSIQELQAGVRAKVERDERRLRELALKVSGNRDEEVIHYVVDFSQGFTAGMEQVKHVWGAIQELADKEEANARKEKKNLLQETPLN